MCLGIPGRVVGPDTDHPDLAVVDVSGVHRQINVGMLDEAVAAGDWILIHMGFAMSSMAADEARAALDYLQGQAQEDEVMALGTPWPQETARP